MVRKVKHQVSVETIGTQVTTNIKKFLTEYPVFMDADRLIQLKLQSGVLTGVEIDQDDLDNIAGPQTIGLPIVLTGQSLGASDSPTFAGLTVEGDVTITGTTTRFESTVITVKDPVFTLGGSTPPAADDNKDRGIEFRYRDGAGAKIGFFGFDDSTGRFTFIPNATNTAEVFSGTVGDVEVNEIFVDTVSERTLDNGVAIDGVSLKNGGIFGTNVSVGTPSGGSDSAFFAQQSNFNVNDFAIGQTALGIVTINAMTGKDISFAINNVSQGHWNATGLTVGDNVFATDVLDVYVGTVAGDATIRATARAGTGTGVRAALGRETTGEGILKLFDDASAFTALMTSAGDSFLKGGNFAVGFSTPISARIHIRGVDATSTNFALKVQDNVGTELFNVRNDGNISIGTIPTTTRFTVRGSGSNNTTISLDVGNSTTSVLKIFDGGDLLIGQAPTAGAIMMGDVAVTSYRLSIRSINNTANALQLYRSISTNEAGVIHAFAMNDSASAKTEIAYAVGTMVDNTAGSVKGAFAVYTRDGASILEKFRIDEAGRVGIGTIAPATSAKLEISSTTGAVLFPRMTTTQRDALTAVDGMVIYNSTLDKLQVRAAAAWVSLH